jgi:hypothetical protein
MDQLYFFLLECRGSEGGREEIISCPSLCRSEVGGRCGREVKEENHSKTSLPSCDGLFFSGCPEPDPIGCTFLIRSHTVQRTKYGTHNYKANIIRSLLRGFILLMHFLWPVDPYLPSPCDSMSIGGGIGVGVQGFGTDADLVKDGGIFDSSVCDSG